MTLYAHILAPHAYTTKELTKFGFDHKQFDTGSQSKGGRHVFAPPSKRHLRYLSRHLFLLLFSD